jgi:hypothetical protein
MFGDNAMLVLFMIMLLGLALCSFLGGAGCSKEGFSDYNSVETNNSTETNNSANNSSNSYKKGPGRFIENYDNYNHYTKESYPSIFYGPNGETAKVIQSDSGNVVVITTSDGNTKSFVIPSSNNNGKSGSNNGKSGNADATVYNGPNGMTAVIITDDDGDKAIRVTDSNNKVVVYSVNQPAPASVNDNNSSRSSSHKQYKTLDEKTVTSSEVDNASTLKNHRSNSSNLPNSSNSSTSYDKYLPPGIPKSDIPPGDEDLYILKSQVVPPVCPACPAYLGAANAGDLSNSDGSSSDKCPPCPACDRCPEPAYDCKLVPNYSNFNSDFMPMPLLSGYSTFGM